MFIDTAACSSTIVLSGFTFMMDRYENNNYRILVVSFNTAVTHYTWHVETESSKLCVNYASCVYKLEHMTVLFLEKLFQTAVAKMFYLLRYFLTV